MSRGGGGGRMQEVAVNVYSAPIPPPPPSSQHSDSNRRIILPADSPDLPRLYQLWPGNNTFCLGGRLIFGPDVRSIYLTLFLIVSPVILFGCFVSPRLIRDFHHGLAIVIICPIFTAYVILLLFLTSARDPGIIPRKPHPPEDEGSTVSADWPGIHGVTSVSLPPTRDVIVNGVIFRVKYCHTCMLYRPPRCSHCSICNNCVERFDHHCPWVGQCIGKRNYRFFFMFVSSTTLLCLYVFAFCWVNIRKIMQLQHCNLWRAFNTSPVSGILILYTFVCVWFVGGLTSFHLYLIFTNQTTYENFRYRYEGKMNPYNQGCSRNAAEIFLTRIPKSKNNFRAKVKAESSSSVYSNSIALELSSSPDILINMEAGKRQAVAEEDLEDMQSQIESISGELERCGTFPRSFSSDFRTIWEITPETGGMLAAELGRRHGLADRQNISRDHEDRFS